MNTKKNCIFHHPKPVIKDGKSGSGIRPYQLLCAFKEIGYNVIEITGYATERKQKIVSAKRLINDGLKIDFIYSESSTEPTQLTEINHFPVLPFDFSFFKFCKNTGIPIGLFYRDMYWKFPEYKKSVGLCKYIVALLFYKYDLYAYNKYVDILYLPSKSINEVIKSQCQIKELPPGCSQVNNKIKILEKKSYSLKLVYVGGIGYYYNLTKLLETLKELNFCHLTICCRANEWELNKEVYKEFCGKNIEIVHKSGNDLMEIYENSDIAMLFFDSEGYRSYAMPIKLFEYLGYEIPIIATSNSCAGEFVESNDIGWSIPFTKEALELLLNEIIISPNLLESKRKKTVDVKKKNSWIERSLQVAEDMRSIKVNNY
ncbi:MAG: glycosyltransferase [Malacoplasma sp.]